LYCGARKQNKMTVIEDFNSLLISSPRAFGSGVSMERAHRKASS
jgi:hypothetical protein